MFRESIQKMIDRLDSPGGATGVLMGFDGIAVDSYVRPASVDAPVSGPVDVQTVSMELAHIVGQIRRSSQGAHLGGLREMQINTDKVAMLIRLVTDDYFLVFGVPPDSNLGKARYLLRLLAPEIRAEL
jgi:predicted regulator of Ras-like GTPase activity (Roadblock/LC7/MglB family)